MRLTGRDRLTCNGKVRASQPHDPFGPAWITGTVEPAPHPELEDETRTLHLWLVESSVTLLGTDVDAISAAVCLPAWNVRRALFALGLGPDPRKSVTIKTAPNFGTTTSRRPA